MRLLILLAAWLAQQGLAANVDSRLRTVLYSPDEVYRLPARLGYEIELEFQPGEMFVGLGSGDGEAIAFKAEANHLFIKPKAGDVRTNLTVLTDRRVYRFDYRTLAPDATIDQIDTVYALRFLYPEPRPRAATSADLKVIPATSAQALLDASPAASMRNIDYWYCGASELRPRSTWDDGVHTHLIFGANAEIPAVFVMNEDGTEALVNFSVLNDELVVHRVAKRLVLRRGKLLGCVLNRSFNGAGEGLSSKTISSRVERKLRVAGHEIGP